MSDRNAMIAHMTYLPIAPPNNSLALASVILGGISWLVAGLMGLADASPLSLIIALLLAGVPGILAIIFGFVGISTANRLGGKRRALAIWGVVLGFTPAIAWLITALGILVQINR